MWPGSVFPIKSCFQESFCVARLRFTINRSIYKRKTCSLSLFIWLPFGGHLCDCLQLKGAPTQGRIPHARTWVKCPPGLRQTYRPSPLGLSVSGGRHHHQRHINASGTIDLATVVVHRRGKRLGISFYSTYKMICLRFLSKSYIDRYVF